MTEQPIGLFEHERLEREAAEDAAELVRITHPVPLDADVSDSAYVIRHGCTGMCYEGHETCDCGAAPVPSVKVAAAVALKGWRGLFDSELAHPALLALYVMAAVAAAALSALYPWGFGS